MHSLSTKEPLAHNEGFSTKATIAILIFAVVVGGASGFIYKQVIAVKTSALNRQVQVSNQKAKEVVGIAGKKNFKDQAEGILKRGGIDGEGSHHLERPGGTSQNVYLTSSTADLSGFENKRVRVHGETFAAEKAGWLMDVGLVEVLE